MTATGTKQCACGRPISANSAGAADGPGVSAAGLGGGMTLDDQIARCNSEIAEAERMLREGAPHEDTLLIWMADWAREKKRLEGLKEANNG